MGSSLVLIIFIATFYYQKEKTLYFDLTKSNMQNTVSKISTQVIFAHMSNSDFDKTRLLDNKKYKVAFYDENKNKIFGNLEKKVNFNKKLTQEDKNFILIDDSTLGHLGIFYIVLEENVFIEKIQELKLNILLFFILIYLLIALIGSYLAKLFLKPIKEERIKLNNFIKDTTHELNTPITAILMSIESKNLSDKQLERVRLSTKRISEIYNDLTYIFLQNQNQNQENLKEELLLNEVLREQLTSFEPLSLKKKIEIKLDLEEFKYLINKDDFIRVINNLISNAIKYNHVSGKVFITLKNKTLVVKDTGIGIEKEKIKDIYKRYFRATSEQGGFGIGLNIVSHVCKKYDIKIYVSSKINEGTTFFLKF